MKRYNQTLTNTEIEEIRIIVAKAAEFPPDDIKILTVPEGSPALYGIDRFNDEYDLVVGYDSIPTIKEVWKDITELYLQMKDWEENSI